MPASFYHYLSHPSTSLGLASTNGEKENHNGAYIYLMPLCIHKYGLQLRLQQGSTKMKWHTQLQVSLFSLREI